MEDSNSASLSGRIASWRSRTTKTLAGSRRRKVATAAALMLASLALFDPDGFEGKQGGATSGAQNLSEDEFEQIEAMLAELEGSPGLNADPEPADSTGNSANSPSSQSPSNGTLLIPSSPDDSASDPVTGGTQHAIAATDTQRSLADDSPSADLTPSIHAAARGISYTGTDTNSSGEAAVRIRLIGTIDPL